MPHMRIPPALAPARPGFLLLQVAAPLASLRGAWAGLLNALNAADLALHGAYAALLARLLWRQAQPLAARAALLAGAAHPAQAARQPASCLGAPCAGGVLASVVFLLSVLAEGKRV